MRNQWLLVLVAIGLASVICPTAPEPKFRRADVQANDQSNSTSDTTIKKKLFDAELYQKLRAIQHQIEALEKANQTSTQVPRSARSTEIITNDQSNVTRPSGPFPSFTVRIEGITPDYSLSLGHEAAYLHNPHRRTNDPVEFYILRAAAKDSSKGTNVNVTGWKEVNPITWRLTLEDTSTIDLVKQAQSPNVTEFQLYWAPAPTNASRGIELCFNYASSDYLTKWYTTYQTDGHPSKPNTYAWPLSRGQKVPLAPLNQLPNSLTQNAIFLSVEHLVLNSNGYGILPFDGQPVQFRILRGDLCYRPSSSNSPLKLRLFTSTNIRTVRDYVVHQSGFIPKPTEAPSPNTFVEPSFHTGSAPALILDSVSRNSPLGAELVGYGFLLMFNWNITRDEAQVARQTDASSLKLGAIASPHAPRFSFPNREAYFVFNMSSLVSAFDFSNPDAASWYSRQLASLLRANPDFQSLVLNSYSVMPDDDPSKYGFQDPEFQRNPVLLVQKYVNLVAQVTRAQNRSVASMTVFRNQDLPVWVRLWLKNDSEEKNLIQSNIANALALSIAGYAWIQPFTDSRATNETLIRYVQATAFFPRMAFQELVFGGLMRYTAQAKNLTTKYIELHQAHADLFVELSRKRIADGSPILRPLWYNYPDDARTYPIADQYMVGETILVAPIMQAGQYKRTVYLPEGDWIAAIDGERIKGPKEFIANVPIDQLAYFKKALE